MVRIFLFISAFIASGIAKHSISKEKCDEFYPDGKFITFRAPSDKGHEVAESNEFPYMAAIGYETEKGEFKYTCGGVLIDPKYILCPAYCVSPIRPSWKSISVYLNKNDMSNPQTLTGKIRANRTIVNPNWDSHKYNQIALIELEESALERPICLWEREIDEPYPTLLIYESDSKKLWKTPEKVVSNDDCEKSYTVDNLPKGLLDNQMCAQETNKDDFRLPSSGPLIIQRMMGKSFIPYVIGITSVALRGGNAPSVFERVPSYINWIESTIWQNE